MNVSNGKMKEDTVTCVVEAVLFLIVVPLKEELPTTSLNSFLGEPQLALKTLSIIILCNAAIPLRLVKNEALHDACTTYHIIASRRQIMELMMPFHVTELTSPIRKRGVHL